MPRLPYEEKARVWELVGYKPTGEKVQQAHRSAAQHMVGIGGEGGGKSYAGAMELLPHTILPPFLRDGVPIDRLYWIVAPEYELARPEFEYLHDALSRIGGVVSVSFPAEGACSLVTVTGTVVQTRSADQPTRVMAGRGPQGILYCEMGMLTQNLWERGFTRLMRSEEGIAGWSWGGGIMQRALPWFLEFHDMGDGENAWGIESFHLPTWENLVLFPGGRKDPKILQAEATLSKVDFLERIAAEKTAPADRVLPEFEYKKHVKKLPFVEWRDYGVEGDRHGSRRLAVTLAVDPGYRPGAYAVLAVQDHHPYIHVIDEIYARETTVDQVIKIAMQRPWWENVVTGVIDPFGGTQHQAMESHQEAWMRQAGIMLHTPTRATILQGIERYRQFLARGSEGVPYLFYDPRCENAIREHRLYRRHDSPEGRALRVNPIDRDNHAIKAVTYWLLCFRGAAGSPSVRRAPAKSDFVFT
jgi:hypothetical protein